MASREHQPAWYREINRGMLCCFYGILPLFGLLLIGFLFSNAVHFALAVIGVGIAAVFGAVGAWHVVNGNRLRRQQAAADKLGRGQPPTASTETTMRMHRQGNWQSIAWGITVPILALVAWLLSGIMHLR